MIPRPTVARKTGPGTALGDGMVVAADERCQQVAALLAAELAAGTGWQVHTAPLGTARPQGTVRLRVEGPAGTNPHGHLPNTGTENYRLTANADGIDITAPSPAGVFYGTRTLRQLLPPAMLRAAPSETYRGVVVEGLEVEDSPRFAWRGMMLDVSRHFFPKDFVLKLVDLASFHKLNVLHLHLTDDQGWRVQIDRYPALTEVGAWRRESPAGHYTERRKDGVPHGGFYTRADLSEIVAYAARRFVTVVPEIDMPGHMQAAVAAYPELGNTGERLEVLTDWGISEHVLNLDEPAVRFCAGVLEDLMEIFPGPYLHVGGDECPTVEWEASTRAHQLCAERGLAGVHQLQSWFTTRMAEVVGAKGRKLIGWDEVLDAGAPPGAAIMAWRRAEARRVATEAAHTGHPVVMAPETWTYFDQSYADDPREPVAIRPAVSVQQAYSFEPIPDGLPADLEDWVLGAQCQLWTEYVSTPVHAEYMYFPRACALAEVAWSGRERDWPGFEARLRQHEARLDALGVNHRPLDGPTPGQARTWTAPSPSRLP